MAVELLHCAGSLPLSIQKALKPKDGEIDPFRTQSPKSTNPGKGWDALGAAPNALEASKENGYAALLGYEFDKTPEWKKQDFLQVMSQEENDAVVLQEAAEEAHLEALNRMRVLLNKRQDLELVSLVAQKGEGDWGAVLEAVLSVSDESSNFSKLDWTIQLDTLKRRLQILRQGLDEVEHLETTMGPRGQLLIVSASPKESKRPELGPEKTVDPNEHEDLCHECGVDPGVLILCEQCPRAYCLECADLEELPPEEEDFICPHCTLVDDSGLEVAHVQQYIRTWEQVAQARRKTEKAGFVDGGGGEGITTKSFKQIVQSNDNEFERLTREIESSGGFKTESLLVREQKKLDEYTQRGEQELEEYREKRRMEQMEKLAQGGVPFQEEAEVLDGDDVDQVEEEEDDDEEDDEEEEDDEDEEVEGEGEEEGGGSSKMELDVDGATHEGMEEDEEDEGEDEEEEDDEAPQIIASPVPPPAAPVHSLVPRRVELVTSSGATQAPVNTLAVRRKN